MNITIKPVEKIPNLYVLHEDGKSVIDIDVQKSEFLRVHKLQLLRDLAEICRAVQVGGTESLDDFVKKDILKKLEKDEKAIKLGNLWEVRSNRHPGRILFILQNPNLIVVAVVNKGTVSRSDHPQTQAINRGANRWKTLLKSLETKV